MANTTTVKKPRFKRQRRLGLELPGLGKEGALDRRPYPPGQHGTQRRKLSEYALRLEEKQKILNHYCMKEKQLRRFIREAKSGQVTDWIDKLVGRLERRLDNLVFRLGFAPSIPAARQMIGHGHVHVNGGKCDIGSRVLMVGDKITLAEKMYTGVSYMQASQSPRLELADYLGKEKEGKAEVGVLRDIPKLEHLPFPFEQGLLAEYYAARKV